ncbi:MAG: DUF5335 family protein [Janthinobacterium lividum]
MDTQELPQSEWAEFLDDLSREFEEGLVSVTVSGNGMSDAPVITSLPLIGIQLNTKGSDSGSITVIAGRDEDTAISHTIPSPSQIHVARDADDAIAAIQIDAPDPAQTQIHFLSAS